MLRFHSLRHLRYTKIFTNQNVQIQNSVTKIENKKPLVFQHHKPNIQSVQNEETPRFFLDNESSLYKELFRMGFISFTTIATSTVGFCTLGICSYKLLGHFIGLDISAVPFEVYNFGLVLGTISGIARLYVNLVEWGAIESSSLKRICFEFVDSTLPKNIKTFKCNIHKDFGGPAMIEFLKKTNYLKTYGISIPRWYMYTIIYNMEPCLHEVEELMNSPEPCNFDRHLLTQVLVPHFETIFSDFIAQQRRLYTHISFYGFFFLLLTFMLPSIFERYIDDISEFVTSYEFLKDEHGEVINEWDALYITTVGIIIHLFKTIGVLNRNDALLKE